ncbi:MAG: hypothetical protein QOJ54_2535, partial [Aliidongia sp.]|nr:hypothetical protein [Aliidongia sp.]
MLQNMIFDHFSDEPVQCTSTGGCLLKDRGTGRGFFNPTLHGVKL